MVPPARVEVVTASVFAATTINKGADLLCTGLPASLTVTIKLEVPLAVGVPEITPVEAANVRPAGRLPEVTDQL